MRSIQAPSSPSAAGVIWSNVAVTSRKKRGTRLVILLLGRGHKYIEILENTELNGSTRTGTRFPDREMHQVVGGCWRGLWNVHSISTLTTFSYPIWWSQSDAVGYWSVWWCCCCWCCCAVKVFNEELTGREIEIISQSLRNVTANELWRGELHWWFFYSNLRELIKV